MIFRILPSGKMTFLDWFASGRVPRPAAQAERLPIRLSWSAARLRAGLRTLALRLTEAEASPAFLNPSRIAEARGSSEARPACSRALVTGERELGLHCVRLRRVP